MLEAFVSIKSAGRKIRYKRFVSDRLVIRNNLHDIITDGLPTVPTAPSVTFKTLVYDISLDMS